MPRQQSIPGTERKVIDDIEAAAEVFLEQRGKSKAQHQREIAARDALIRAIKKHGLSKYRVGDVMVTVDQKDVVKTKAIDDEAAA